MHSKRDNAFWLKTESQNCLFKRETANPLWWTVTWRRLNPHIFSACFRLNLRQLRSRQYEWEARLLLLLSRSRTTLLCFGNDIKAGCRRGARIFTECFRGPRRIAFRSGRRWIAISGEKLRDSERREERKRIWYSLKFSAVTDNRVQWWGPRRIAMGMTRGCPLRRRSMTLGRGRWWSARGSRDEPSSGSSDAARTHRRTVSLVRI